MEIFGIFLVLAILSPYFFVGDNYINVFCNIVLYSAIAITLIYLYIVISRDYRLWKRMNDKED